MRQGRPGHAHLKQTHPTRDPRKPWNLPLPRCWLRARKLFPDTVIACPWQPPGPVLLLRRKEMRQGANGERKSNRNSKARTSGRVQDFHGVVRPAERKGGSAHSNTTGIPPISSVYSPYRGATCSSTCAQLPIMHLILSPTGTFHPFHRPDGLGEDICPPWIPIAREAPRHWYRMHVWSCAGHELQISYIQ